LPTPKSVCYISNNTYSVSFDGAKDTAYTAKYGHSPEMKQGRGRGKERGEGKGKGREGTGKRKRKEGTEGRFATRGWKAEGRKEREGGMGN